MTAPSGASHLHTPESDASGCPAGFAAARAVADAVLYEGYLLYPYRRSSGKNRVRWQFGVLAPRSWIEAGGPAAPTVAGAADAWQQRTECLLEAAPDARVFVRLRFLQLQHRSVRDETDRELDALEAGGVRHLTFDEAVPREVDIAVDLAALHGDPHITPVEFPGGEEAEALPDGSGRVVRTRAPVSAVVRVSRADAPAPFLLHLLRVEIENTVADLAADAPRPDALRRSLLAAHTLLGVRGGAFLSLLDPPAWAAHAAGTCVNLHTFPVLAGSDDAPAGVVLSSPIILYDHPRVAPESPGDLFDAGEIDEILTLRTLTLTDEEKREARATDARAAEVIDRADAIPREVLARLHGAVRSLTPVGQKPVGPNASSPRRPRTGSAHRRCRCRPRPGGTRARTHRSPRGRTRCSSTGSGWCGGHGCACTRGPGAPTCTTCSSRAARRAVEAVLLDVDGSTHLAVTVDDDPGADLHRWYGRHHYFAPDEVAPCDGAP